jgi:predicted 3-demethylubiquinone-9 3-methyltransferase (glyoxalase superfamily)
MKNLSTCLWFDNQAEEAVKFYATVFKNSKVTKTARYGKSGAAVSGQKEGAVMTVEFQLENLTVLALNGGPLFKFTPALSFSVCCSTEEEIDAAWKKLADGGTVRMGLDKYPWSAKYGWTADRYGVEWQLMLAPRAQKIAPAILFVEELFGKGEEAVNFYTSLFPNSKIDSIARDEATKTVMHCAFTLNGQSFVLMEGQGKHAYTFSHATSLVVTCDNQSEVDTYWQKLSAGGSEEQCGWLKDRFGVSWQIVPSVLGELMANPAHSESVMKAMLKMTKLDIAALTKAAE